MAKDIQHWRPTTRYAQCNFHKKKVTFDDEVQVNCLYKSSRKKRRVLNKKINLLKTKVTKNNATNKQSSKRRSTQFTRKLFAGTEMLVLMVLVRVFWRFATIWTSDATDTDDGMPLAQVIDR